MLRNSSDIVHHTSDTCDLSSVLSPVPCSDYEILHLNEISTWTHYYIIARAEGLRTQSSSVPAIDVQHNILHLDSEKCKPVGMIYVTRST